VRSSDLEHVLVRSAPVYGVGGLWFTAIVHGTLATPPFTVSPGTQEVAPVLADDLAAVLAAADDREGEVAGTWELEGPDVVAVDRLMTLLAGDEVSPVPLPPAEAARRFEEVLGVPLSVSACQLFARESRAHGPSAADAFGVERTRLAEGIRLTLERGVGTSLER
jgi:uncharacterized protein YbjT (DUF2867 family)